MYGVVPVELPKITSESFAHTLVSDDVFPHFLNEFLSTLFFSEILLYNQKTGVFEVVNDAAQVVSRNIRTALQQTKSQLYSGDPSLLTPSPVDNCYTVSCLAKDEGIEWVREERLPFFLQSDCYFEYRLAKMLWLWEPILCVQKKKISSLRRSWSAPELRSSTEFNKKIKNALQLLKRSHSLDQISSKKGMLSEQNSPRFFSDRREYFGTTYEDSFCSVSESDNVRAFSPRSSTPPYSTTHEPDTTQDLQSSEPSSHLHITEPSAGSVETDYLAQFGSQNLESSELQLESVAASVVKQLSIMDDQTEGNISDCFNKPGEQTNFSEEKWCESAGSGGERETDWDENREMKSWCPEQEQVCDVCRRGTCYQENRPALEEFKEFLQGTTGEKLFSLWMDIEKLKSLQDSERINRHLVWMRNRYLLSSSHSSMNPELLSTLGLKTSPCWTDEKLCSVQPSITQDLLYYWAPRFWTSIASHDMHNDDGDRLWIDWWNNPLLERPHCEYFTMPPLHDPCLSETSISFSVEEQKSSSVERMSQSLYVESRAGFYFTNFCVKSENQLWENAIYFWSDLQHFHELFYQDGPDPYRVQREAQRLYSTYLYTYAVRNIGVSELVRSEVYNRLRPAFEDLFDKAEQHALDILLQSWTVLVSRDRESFKKVCQFNEVHTVEGEEYRELQIVLEESERRLREFMSLQPSGSSSSSKDPRMSESWSAVPARYQGYTLEALLCHRHEPEYFMKFLHRNNASIHLQCFGDLEQYNRTRENKILKQERSSQIATKYLNKTYFFGPSSPANVQQQDEIFDTTGGMESMKIECLSDDTAARIQEIVKAFLEKTWLPLFLASPEFLSRHKHQQPNQSGGRRSLLMHRRRAKRKSLKPEGLWMSSSKEILELRQLLLNPVTCLQFQHFVALKEGFLENDLLFWLEVQRYKDLCHSHSSNAIIEQKISTIIDCFIDSTLPPEVRIDISTEQAQLICNRRQEIGPYIFREAQLAVFRELLKFWPKFQELSSSVEAPELLPMLKQKRVKHRARVRRERRRDEEVEQELEDEERRKLAMQEWDMQEYDTDSEPDDEPDGKNGKKRDWRSWKRVLLSPSEPMSWSYSKYLAALKKEEMMLSKSKKSKKVTVETSVSTISDDSSLGSIRSGASGAHAQRSSKASSSKKK